MRSKVSTFLSSSDHRTEFDLSFATETRGNCTSYFHAPNHHRCQTYLAGKSDPKPPCLYPPSFACLIVAALLLQTLTSLGIVGDGRRGESGEIWVAEDAGSGSGGKTSATSGSDAVAHEGDEANATVPDLANGRGSFA